MKILITGATGFIGSRLCQTLAAAGHTLVALSRNADAAKRRVPSLQQAFGWQPASGPPPLETFEGVDAVVNLAGESLAGRWTASKKQAIRDSRLLGTRHLVDAISQLGSKPKALVSVSAVGYYGDRGEERLNEDSPPASDFLGQLCADWEAEATRAEELGVRVVRLRPGIVLGPGGGALARLLTPFKLGMGGPLGSGRQWWSWVHLDDVVGLIVYSLEHQIAGPINATTPDPVRQRDFARTLGRVLRRPAFMPAPAFMLRLMLGEVAGGLLASLYVLPERAQEAGYSFRFTELEHALRDILTKRM
jgi:uncharacterized protein (TIGR01777 family)